MKEEDAQVPMTLARALEVYIPGTRIEDASRYEWLNKHYGYGKSTMPVFAGFFGEMNPYTLQRAIKVYPQKGFDVDKAVAEVEEFLTALRPVPPPAEQIGASYKREDIVGLKMVKPMCSDDAEYGFDGETWFHIRYSRFSKSEKTPIGSTADMVKHAALHYSRSEDDDRDNYEGDGY